MTSELAERLRAANPVSPARPGCADEGLLRRIVGTPRVVEHPRRLSGRRLLIVLAAAVIVGGGIAAAFSKFAPEYVGSDDREPPPAAVLAQLRSLASEGVPGGLADVDEEGLVRLAAFEAEGGLATIFAAPVRAGTGFCSVDAMGEEITGGACQGPRSEDAVPYIGHGSSHWGDVRALVGRLEAPAVRIELRFEDDSSKAASIRAPWWVYVVGGDETEPGHRPVELITLDTEGAIVVREELEPYFFTSRDAARELLPESDGTVGQNAIRAVLEGLGGWAESALPVQIDGTRLLRRIETGEGTFEVYAAPSRGGVCFAMVYSRLPVEGTTGCPHEDEPVANRPATFDVDPSSILQVAPSVFELVGTPPAGAARVEIRFEDGASVPADIFLPSFLAAWVGPGRLATGHRPTGLVAFDDDGRELATFSLDTRWFGP